MPSPSPLLQSRIQQFEALENRSKSPKENERLPVVRKPVVYPPPLQPRVNAIRNPLNDPISPAANAISPMKPVVPYVPRKPRSTSASPSPPNLGIKTSLIDLKDWVDDIPRTENTASPQSNGKPIIKPKPSLAAPALPPRNSVVKKAFTPASTPKVYSPRPPSSPKATDSLSVTYSYPPFATLSAATPRQNQGHIHASSTSSFHSISLSSDGGAAGSNSTPNASFKALEKDENDHDLDGADDSFSFEDISSGAISTHPTASTQDWEYDMSLLSLGERPKAPEDTLIDLHSSATVLKSPNLPPKATEKPASMVRRVPPPVPPAPRSRPPSHRTSLASTTTGSDQSSIFSNRTSTSEQTSSSVHTALSRPTPVPPNARKRYEGLFASSLKAQQRARKAKLSPSSVNAPSATSPRKGWRGLSVDLITSPPIPTSSSDHAEKQTAEILDKELDGKVVNVIWSQSRLRKEQLKAIWDECALPDRRSLDREAFVKGMWRIDEELRRARNAREFMARGRPRPLKRTNSQQ